MKKIVITLIVLIPFVSVAQDASDIQKLLYSKRYSSAESSLRQRITKDPSETTNFYWLAQTLLQKKDSIGLLNILLSLPSQDEAWVLTAKGIIALESGKVSDARINFARAISITKGKNTDVLAAVARANIYSGKGDKAYALEQLKRALKRSKNNPELYFLQGEVHMRLRNGSDAFTSYGQAVKVDGRFTPALYGMGIIFTTQHNADVYLKYFHQALEVDPSFAPALYQLYYHYYKTDVGKAYNYFEQYLKNTDVDESDEYQLADILYLSGKYDESIRIINTLLRRDHPENRLNKLLGYTYKETGKVDSALFYMNRYFSNGADSTYLGKDYEFMIGLYDSIEGGTDSVIAYYQRLLPLSDENQKAAYYKKLAASYKLKKDYESQAFWLKKYYYNSPGATNVDLFNLGLAYFQSQKYKDSDSIFAKYVSKYPEQVFGYYWRARSNAAIDTTMKLGLAVPLYKQVVEIASKDTTNETNRRYLVEAYGYLAAHTVNEEKNYAGAIDYFEKLLILDPANADANKYIEILRKAIASD